MIAFYQIEFSCADFSHFDVLVMVCAAIAMINPLFIKEGEVLDSGSNRVATIFQVSTPEELQQLQPENARAENIVIDLLDWQVCMSLAT